MLNVMVYKNGVKISALCVCAIYVCICHKCTHKFACVCYEETRASLLSSCQNLKSCSSSVMTSVRILILLILKAIKSLFV